MIKICAAINKDKTPLVVVDKRGFYSGRSDRVRTCGLNIPNVARYQLRHTPIAIPFYQKRNEKSTHLRKIPLRKGGGNFMSFLLRRLAGVRASRATAAASGAAGASSGIMLFLSYKREHGETDNSENCNNCDYRHRIICDPFKHNVMLLSLLIKPFE